MAPQRLGQHFLADASWRERIAQSVFAATACRRSSDERTSTDADRRETWIEIGAGHGEMTKLLASRAGRLVAIELDPRLVAQLRETVTAVENVKVIAGDVLSLDLPALAGGEPYSVYGNLPYYITSPILHRVLSSTRLQAAFFVMQREVAERIVADPGSRDYGYLSVFAQFHARAEILFQIPPGAFRPPPKVDSALLALRPPGRAEALGLAGAESFLEFAKVCFAHKRKTLRNNLRARANARMIEQALLETGLPPDVRAEQLSLDQFAELFRRLTPEAAPRKL